MSQDLPTDEVRKVQIDFAGLMKVVGANLYSTPIVAIRELVQNAHDSCIRRQLEAEESGSPLDFAPQITVRCQDGILEVQDNGAGLTRQEIIDYLATIGAGFTRKLRATHSDAQLIGAFGLGFLSAYVLGRRVEVWTTSHKDPGTRWLFSSHTGEQFTLRESKDAGEVGSIVRVHLKEEHDNLRDLDRLDAILQTYCCLLPLPIELEGVGSVNGEPVPWLDTTEASSAVMRQKRMVFAQRFSQRFEPLATVAIPPKPEIGFRGGLAWIHGGGSYATTDHRDASVFVRGMLVTRHDRELLPQWAGFVGAVLDSKDLTPTASREDLTVDDVYTSTQHHVRESLIAGLEQIHREEPATWRRLIRFHNESLLGASLGDERLFTLLGAQLTVPTSEGDRTLKELTRGRQKLHISLLETQGPEQVLFQALGKPIVTGNRFAVYPFVKRFCATNMIQLVELGTQQGNAQMFPQTQLSQEELDEIKAIFSEEKMEIIPTRFAPTMLPLIIVHDQELKLKRRLEDSEADRRISAGILSLARQYTNQIDDSVEAKLYINLDAPVIQKLLQMEDKGSQEHVALLIRAMGTLMAPDRDRPGQIEGALRQFETSILSFLN